MNHFDRVAPYLSASSFLSSNDGAMRLWAYSESEDRDVVINLTSVIYNESLWMIDFVNNYVRGDYDTIVKTGNQDYIEFCEYIECKLMGCDNLRSK